ITTGGAQVGDHIILTKGAALEGTAILAAERESYLLQTGKWAPEEIQAAKTHRKHLSVIRDSEIAVNNARVNAMHDPTEGGVASALHELADAANTGFRVYKDKIPVSAETAKICGQFNIDPLYLIGSGALLLTVPADDVDRLLSAYREAGIVASDIGVVLRETGTREIVMADSTVAPLHRPAQDALWSALKS
ncbi:MAG: AIR synthase-related protein, partial [Candidatus Ranarchaeia archaeon]